MSQTFEIEKLGGGGDGIAHCGDVPVYIAGALPGETVLAERDGARARLIEIMNPSEQRIAPFCPYYEACGGCITQHMKDGLYRDWKRDIVVHALGKAGLTTDIAPLEYAHGAGRRRITLHVRFIEREMVAGFMTARSHALVAIDKCPVTVEALFDAPRLVKEIGRILRSSKPISVQVTASDNGLDLDIRGHGPASDSLRQRLVTFADTHDLARIAVHGDVVAERRPPFVRMGHVAVVPPAGGFLQATSQGETVLVGHVRALCGSAKRIADLFSGCGPFALTLAENAEVHAVESDRDSLLALERTFRSTSGLRRISTEARDLFRRPLLKHELEAYDAIVLDPPRAGAEAQMRQLANANVPTVVSVSCDPGTFARDASVLTQGGYTLERVIPVDQFAFSAHVETVALFRKAVAKKKKRLLG